MYLLYGSSYSHEKNIIYNYATNDPLKEIQLKLNDPLKKHYHVYMCKKYFEVLDIHVDIK